MAIPAQEVLDPLAQFTDSVPVERGEPKLELGAPLTGIWPGSHGHQADQFNQPSHCTHTFRELPVCLDLVAALESRNWR